MRTLIAALCVLSVSGCVRAIKLPTSKSDVVSSPVKKGVNASMAAFDFETSGVDVQIFNGTGNLTVTGLPVSLDRVDLKQTRSFDVRQGSKTVAHPACTLTQKGQFVAWGGVTADDQTNRAVDCNDANFSLELKQNRSKGYVGTAVKGDVHLRIVSGLEMAKGPSSNSIANGFHLYRENEWVGSVEYFYGGKFYLPPSLTPDEREAVLLTGLTIACTDGYLFAKPDENARHPLSNVMGL